MDPLVRFQPSGRSLRVPLGTTLLEAAKRAGLPMASACGAYGLCGRCGVDVMEGATALSPESSLDSDVKRRNRVAAEQRLACRARVQGPVEITASYW